jgi:hypothetical protein
VWALELLLVLKKEPARTWTYEHLIRELRGSQSVVQAALRNLTGMALVVEDPGKIYRYKAASEHIEGLVQELENLYASKPSTVIRAIMMLPEKKLNILSDAFKIVR